MSSSSPPSPSPSLPLRVAALFAYPVKSCAPIDLSGQGAALTRDGVPFDRNWAVIRADDRGRGRFLSQRDTPALALVRPSLPAEAFLGKAWGTDLGVGAALTLTIVPTGKSVSIPLAVEVEEGEAEGEVDEKTRSSSSPSPSSRRPNQKQKPLKNLRNVSVWDYDGQAIDEGDEVADLLSDFLQRKVRLVRHAPGVSPRQVDPAWLRRSSSSSSSSSRAVEVAFADAFPLLVTTVASTRAAAEALGRPVEAVRFRPNILLDREGGEGDGEEGEGGKGKPWEEDAWASLSLGTSNPTTSTTLIDLVKPCDRCTIPHVNPSTGERDAADLTKALREGCGRTGAKLGWLALPAWKNAVFFGWNGVVRDREGGVGERATERGEVLGVVRVGDRVEVAERRGEGEGPRGPAAAFLT